mmetsp:Transcript_70681/g.158250  ORF Transcript_70681/g.158250 Transcript_70681/m.158250 type:complete len:299 (+) Transcript_70681:599-1495(+)
MASIIWWNISFMRGSSNCGCPSLPSCFLMWLNRFTRPANSMRITMCSRDCAAPEKWTMCGWRSRRRILISFPTHLTKSNLPSFSFFTAFIANVSFLEFSTRNTSLNAPLLIPSSTLCSLPIMTPISGSCSLMFTLGKPSQKLCACSQKRPSSRAETTSRIWSTSSSIFFSFFLMFSAWTVRARALAIHMSTHACGSSASGCRTTSAAPCSKNLLVSWSKASWSMVTCLGERTIRMKVGAADFWETKVSSISCASTVEGIWVTMHAAERWPWAVGLQLESQESRTWTPRASRAVKKSSW